MGLETKLGISPTKTKVLITTLDSGMQQIDYLVPGGQFEGSKEEVLFDRMEENTKYFRHETKRIRVLRAGIIATTATQGFQLAYGIDNGDVIAATSTLLFIGVMAGVRNYIIGTAMDRLEAAKGQMHGFKETQAELLGQTQLETPAPSTEIFPG